MNADEALARLKQGNARFRAGIGEGASRVDIQRADLSRGQNPFAVVLSCSDSRVPTELVFDTGLGDLFVVRVAGNVPNTSSIASVEYAISQLGTKLVVVMGHENCGAVAAAIAGGEPSRNLSVLLAHIQPALEPPETDANIIVRRNACNTARTLLDQSDIIRGVVESGDVRIVTAFFHFADGEVEFEDEGA